MYAFAGAWHRLLNYIASLDTFSLRESPLQRIIDGYCLLLVITHVKKRGTMHRAPTGISISNYKTPVRSAI